MISTEYFAVNDLQLSDSQALSKLMVENRSRFQRDFPKTLGQNLSSEASSEYIQRKQKEIAAKTEFTWAIRDNGTNQIAGLIILKELDWEKGIGELAYCIGAAYEGRGWMTKTVKALTRWAFKDLSLRTLQIIIHETNVASIRVAEKCDYHWQKKLLKSHTPPDGVALDMELYEHNADLSRRRE